MTIRILMILALLVVGGGRAVWAQPVTTRTPETFVRPVIEADRPTWENSDRHIRIVASYDGNRVKVVEASVGEGSARAYLSQRRDLVVVILNRANRVMREFNLPDPLELRIRERPPVQEIEHPAPRVRESLARPSVSQPPPQAVESTLRLRRTEFELFVPKLDGARWVEFRKGDAKGRRLGRFDLTKVQ